MKNDRFIDLHISAFMTPSEQCMKHRSLTHNCFLAENTLFSLFTGAQSPGLRDICFHSQRKKKMYNMNASNFGKYKETLKRRESPLGFNH